MPRKKIPVNLQKYEPNAIKFVCEWCAQDFWRMETYIKEGNQGRFCSRSCAAKNRAENRRNNLIEVEAVCKCGNKFSYKIPLSGKGSTKGKPVRHQKYCSIECSYSNNGRNVKGHKNPRWKGGKSPYPLSWTPDFRTSIRKRDGRICTICKQHKRLDVHHIDFNKQNTIPENCISLCRVCHPKIHSNSRKEVWKILLSVAAKSRMDQWIKPVGWSEGMGGGT